MFHWKVAMQALILLTNMARVQNLREMFEVKCFQISYMEIRSGKFSTVAVHCVSLKCEKPVSFPVAQMVEHGASNAKIMGSIPRETRAGQM